ncbi:helix-turn-helix transcriptional regulator [Brevundimonas sp.]|uniref:helix-turn-helix domain-containing protein n=1 Tax=Brevundimonas sp. TaxID=1871086 RepID=UPI0028A95911|nr:helix-turn-helix transcriptional regulator [Brevundimonas sp.]
MTDAEETLADTIRARVADRLHWLKLTPITAAKQSGLPRDTIRNLFRRDTALPRADTLAAIAEALETSVAFLMGETVNPGVEKWADQTALEEAVRIARPIPVRSELVDGFRAPLEAPLSYLDLNVEGFETSDLNAFIVADDAMDEIYERGRYVITAPIQQAGLQFGDHVVCMRLVHEGGVDRVETILREFHAGPSGPQLISRTTGEARPIIEIKRLAHEELRFGGAVVADYKPHERTPIPTDYDWPEPQVAN